MELTALRKVLQKHKRIGFDTMLFIYLIEDDVQFAETVEAIFSYVMEYKITPVCSSIVMTELLRQPLRLKRFDIVAIYQDMLFRTAPIEFVDLTVPVATQAAMYAANYNLKTPDAIHLASAVSAGATAFITADKDFTQVKELNTIILHA